MLLRANHDLVLPNGEKIKAGQEFDYAGDLKPIETVVIVLSKKIKAKAEKTKKEAENLTKEDPKGQSDEAEENQNSGGVPEKG